MITNYVLMGSVAPERLRSRGVYRPRANGRGYEVTDQGDLLIHAMKDSKTTADVLPMGWRRHHVWMAPTCNSFFREAQRSLAVMCPNFLCGRAWTAGLDGFRGSRSNQLVGI